MLHLSFVLLGTGAAILIAGFYAGLETAAYGCSPVRLRYLAEQGRPRAALSLGLIRDLSHLVTLTLIGHNLAVYLGTYVLETHLARSGWSRTELWATVMLTPFCFLFAEITPKQLGHTLAEGYLMGGARVLAASRLLFRPLAAFLGGVAWTLRRLLQRLGATSLPPTGREAILTHLDLGVDEGLLDGTQLRLARTLVSAHGRLAAIMVPLGGQTAHVKRTTSCLKAQQIMQHSGLRALPLVDKRRQEVTGIITAEALLMRPHADDQAVETLAETPVQLRLDIPLGRALARLQKGRVKVGVVVDGEKALGLVTAEDLIDEVLGLTEEA